ncbi:hypothetical protein JHW43_007093 [Diplocarpon mali]|nr:hypothetical protein JHW43_007093 [Diplocarpon mali]
MRAAPTRPQERPDPSRRPIDSGRTWKPGSCSCGCARALRRAARLCGTRRMFEDHDPDSWMDTSLDSSTRVPRPFAAPTVGRGTRGGIALISASRGSGSFSRSSVSSTPPRNA